MRGKTRSVIWKIAEVVIVALISFTLTYTVVGVPASIKPLIYLATMIFLLYLEVMCEKMWPRIMLPLSFYSLGLLISRMIVGVVKGDTYIYVVVTYIIASFALYHSLFRIITVFLGDRKSRFRSILEDINMDITIFLIIFSLLSIWLYTLKAIQLWAMAVVVAGSWGMWLFTYRYLSRRVHRMLLTGQAAKWGFAHPVEPEAEKTLLSVSSLVVLVSLMIPLLFSYTSPILIRRGFIPLVLLGVFEAITCLIYLVAYILIVHGAYVEELVYEGKKIGYVEMYKIFSGWRDISWFLNRSAGYYYRLKYLSALYMFFQGVEILSRRVGDKTIYYGELQPLLQCGLEYINRNKLTKYVDYKSLLETYEVFKQENTWVIEADTTPIDNVPEEIKEVYRRLFSSIINLYAKLYDLPSEARKERKKAIETVIERLDSFLTTRIRDIEHKKNIIKIIKYLEELKNKDEVSIEDLERVVVRKPVTVNMIRNYLVHGQLVKNAIIYRGSRDAFDKLMSKPSILYGLYTLLLACVVSKYREKLIH